MVNPTGAGETPPVPKIPAVKAAPLPKNVAKNPSGVNPEIDGRVQEQADAIPSHVPPPSASAPPTPLAHAVVQGDAQPTAPLPIPPVLKPALPAAAKFKSFHSLAAPSRNISQDLNASEKIQKFREASEQVAKLQAEAAQLRSPELAEAERSQAQARATRVDEQLKAAKHTLNEAAKHVMADPVFLKKMLLENSDMAFGALKNWLAQSGSLATPIQCFKSVMVTDLNVAIAFLDSLSALEDSQSQSFINELVKEIGGEDRSRGSRFICELIRRDVTETAHETTLFRTDTMRTKLYTAFQTEMLKPLLQVCIGDVIGAITKTSKDFVSKNPDPRVGKVEYIPNEIGDIKEITLHADSFLNNLLAQLTTKPGLIPPEMRAVYQTLAAAIDAKGWQRNRDTHVNSFLFLRGINPAFPLPGRIGLNLPLNGQQLKNLVALSKAIQDVVNNPTERKGKWDDALFVLGEGERGPTYTASKQTLLAQIGAKLHGK